MSQYFSLRNLKALLVVVAVGLVAFWFLTEPHPLTASAIPNHQANLENGKLIYNAGGCISCHASTEAADEPSGGKPFITPVGVLYPPNLTPDPETGLGKWTKVDFVNAMQRGLSPDGKHLIPAFPYASYAKMKVEDVLDMQAYLASLPAVKKQTPPHQILALPIVRRGLGLWKKLGFSEAPFQPENQSESWNRGAYLVSGPGHCNECHTPRNLFMANDFSRKLQGGPHPDGKGKVPSLVGLIARGKYKDAKDLVLAFQNGEVLGYEHMSSGGMGEVQTNLSKLPESDLQAIAEYLLSFK